MSISKLMNAVKLRDIATMELNSAMHSKERNMRVFVDKKRKEEKNVIQVASDLMRPFQEFHADILKVRGCAEPDCAACIHTLAEAARKLGNAP